MQFRQDALQLVEAIRARGNLPLLVGGTMLYFKALRDGLDVLPPADPALRIRLDAEAARIGSPAMHAKLAALDPATAARLKPNDAQRIQRALEIIELSGQPMSALLSKATEDRITVHTACRSRWSLPTAACCMRASQSASTPCWTTPTPD